MFADGAGDGVQELDRIVDGADELTDPGEKREPRFRFAPQQRLVLLSYGSPLMSRLRRPGGDHSSGRDGGSSVKAHARRGGRTKSPAHR